MYIYYKFTNMYKFTRNEIQVAVESTNSMIGAALRLSISYNAFRRQAIHYGLWEPNPAGKSSMKGKRFKKKSDVFGNPTVVHSHTLHKWYRLESRYECKQCGVSEWVGKQLSLEIDHINGKKLDNRLENLRYLCPNCHSQTDTWKGRNMNNLSAL